MNIQEIRTKYPQYSDLTDVELADGFHSKFYSDIPKETFYQSIGITGQQKADDLSSIYSGLGDRISNAMSSPAKGSINDYSNKSFLGRVGDVMAGAPEAIASMIAGTPEFAASSLGKAGSILTGGVTEEEIQKAGQEAVPKWAEAIAYKPRTETGKAILDAIGFALEGGAKAAALPGAAITGLGDLGSAIISGEPITGKFTSGFERGFTAAEPVTKAALEIGLAGKMAQEGVVSAKEKYKSIQEQKAVQAQEAINKKYQEEKANAPEVKLDEFLRKENEKNNIAAAIEAELNQPKEGKYPSIPDASPLLPEIAKTGEKDIGLPELSEQLKPLSEQGAQSTPIGRVQGGDFSADIKTPLPELPPEAKSGIITKAAELVKALEETKDKSEQARIMEELNNLRNAAEQNGRPGTIDIPEEGMLSLTEKGKEIIPEQPAWQKELGIDFPLRQEVLDSPEVRAYVENTLQRVAEQQRIVDNAIAPKMREKAAEAIKQIQQEFGEYMRQYGVDKPQDALGLQKQWQGGEGTKLPVEKARTLSEFSQKAQAKKNLGGVGKKQGGALDVSAFSGKRSEVTVEDIKAIFKAAGKPYTDKQIEEAYTKVTGNVVKSAMEKKTEVISNIPGLQQAATTQLNKYESRPVETDPTGQGSVSRMEAVGTHDIPKPQSSLSQNFQSQGWLQSWKSKSPVVHEGIGFITSVKDFFQNKAAAVMSDLNKSIRKFEYLNKWEDVQEILSVRRENEFNTNFDPKTRFSGEKLDLFMKIDKTLKDLFTQINTRRLQLNPKATPLKELPYYFTSFFVGDYAIPVFDAATGKYLFRVKETNKLAANRASEWLNKNGYTTGEVEVTKASNYGNRRFDAHSDFAELLSTFGSNDPAVIQAMQRLAAASSKTSYGTSGMPSRFLNKQGLVGSLGDKPWNSVKDNYYGNKQALERYIEGAYEWLGNTQITEMTTRMQESPNITAKNAKQMIQDYADYVTGAKQNVTNFAEYLTAGVAHAVGGNPQRIKTFARDWANINTALFIGYYSPRAIIQNLAQWMQATGPKMAQMSLVEGYKGNIPIAIAEGLWNGIRDLFPDSKGSNTSKSYKMDNHVIDAHLVEMGTTFKNAHLNLAYDVLANKSVAWTEHATRSIAFSIYESFLKSSGLSESRARDMAKNLTKDTMVNYESYSKAQIFDKTGIAGELAGRLQTYKVNQLTQFATYLKDMKASDPKSYVSFVTALGINLALAGGIGLIGMDLAETMFKMAKQLVPASQTGLQEKLQKYSPVKAIYENTHTAFSMGAMSYLTNMNLSGAFAQNLVGNSPLSSIFPVFGGIAEQVQAPFKMFGSDTDKAQALNAILPSSAKQLVESKYLTAHLPSGETQVLSAHNPNKTVWKGLGQGYAPWPTKFQNVQTLERGQRSLEDRIQQTYEKDLTDQRKRIDNNISEDVATLYRGINNKTDTSKVIEDISKGLVTLYNAGGDPEVKFTQIQKQLQDLGIGDSIIAELNKQITLSTRKQYEHAIDTYKRRQERK